MAVARIHQETITVGRNRDTEVIGHRLRHAKACEPPESRCKVDALLVILRLRAHFGSRGRGAPLGVRRGYPRLRHIPLHPAFTAVLYATADGSIPAHPTGVAPSYPESSRWPSPQ